jgi:hypothetical protein
LIIDLVSQKTGLFGNLTLIQSGFLSRWREESIFIRGPKFLPLPQPLITANYILIILSAMPDLSEIFFQKAVPGPFPADIDPSHRQAKGTAALTRAFPNSSKRS